MSSAPAPLTAPADIAELLRRLKSRRLDAFIAKFGETVDLSSPYAAPILARAIAARGEG